MAQSVKAARQALFTACQEVYTTRADSTGAKVLVCYGLPGSYQPQNIVAVLDTRQPVTRPTMGTSRSRNKDVEIDVTVSVFRAGDETQQQLAAEDVDDLVDLLESYFRTSPNERLGGACYDAFVSNIAGPTLFASAQPDSGAVVGYTAEAVVTVTLSVRT